MKRAIFVGLAAMVTAMTSAVISGPARADDQATAIINSLPPALSGLYQGAPQTILPSAYDNFVPPPKPWKWCHSESYQGNPWRVAVTNELHRLVNGLIAKGIVSSFQVSDSNTDASEQINQIRAFIDKKCSIITSVAGSATALNDAIAAAYAAGIPYVTAAGSVTSPKAINVDSNYFRWGYDMIKAIDKGLGGHGRVLMVEGIAGNPIVAQERAGADAALKASPGLHVVRSVNGNWTANVTKIAVLQTLATNPSRIDAVWSTGSETRVIAEAFAQAGRPAPLITGSLTGDALGYWKAHPTRYRFEGNAVLPGWTAETLFRVGARILMGEKPRLNTLMIPIPAVSGADLPQWYKPCMTPDSVSVFPVPPTDPFPDSLMNAYFVNPAPVPTYDYADVPQACASH
jgi:ribose transport system substrate-binding protein